MNAYEILDNISTSVIITNKFTEIIYLNTAAEDLFRNSKSALKNMKINDLFANKKNIIINQIYDAIALNQSSISRDIEMSLKTKNKHYIDCNVQAIFINNEKHALLEIRTIKRIKNILKNANFTSHNNTTQMITRSIAHEIKNPLGGIKGAAQLLKNEINEDYKDYTNIIINEVNRLTSYIDKMLGPKKEPNFKEENIHKLIDNVLVILGTKNNNFIRNYDPSIPLIRIDRDMLTQTLINIIKNAQEAILENGQIEIKTRIDRNFTINSIKHKLVAVISIIDDGVGIDEDIKNKLFLPLITNKQNGSGLGLSISQRLVSINRGIVFFDENNNKTIFKIILPIDKY